MSIAAVPRYLGNNFESASPALRFGMYLPIWTAHGDQKSEFKDRCRRRSREAEDLRRLEAQVGASAAIDELVARQKLPALWTKNNAAGRKAWCTVGRLTDDDRRRVDALVTRQSAMRSTVAPSTLLHIEARSIAPFTTGLGNEHPLENGFAFLNPYGLPNLPGSGVKGVVRRAAEELAHRDFFRASSEWSLPDIWRLFGFEPWPPPQDAAARTSWKEWIAGFSVSKSAIDDYLDKVLPNKATTQLRQRLDEQDDDDDCLRVLLKERTLHARGALEFWDVIPKISGDHLAVEIMTPHQSHYYQGKLHQGSNTPHDSGSPNPISFLTIPPESEFTFHVRCDQSRLNSIAPHLVRAERWKRLVEAAFEHAFAWLGFGAKTAVGYGALQRDRAREQKVHREHEERVRQERAEQEAREREAQEAREHAERIAAMNPIDREIQEVIDSRQDRNMAEITAIIQAVKAGRWEGGDKIEVARRLEARMKEARQWKEESTKRNPDRDRSYQNTLLVKRWQEGK